MTSFSCVVDRPALSVRLIVADRPLRAGAPVRFLMIVSLPLMVVEKVAPV